MMGFLKWVEFSRKKKEKEEKRKRMSDQLANQVKKTGMSITKDKLIDLIKKSPSQSFTVSQSPNSKAIVVVINQ